MEIIWRVPPDHRSFFAQVNSVANKPLKYFVHMEYKVHYSQANSIHYENKHFHYFLSNWIEFPCFYTPKIWCDLYELKFEDSIFDICQLTARSNLFKKAIDNHKPLVKFWLLYYCIHFPCTLKANWSFFTWSRHIIYFLFRILW